MSKDEIWVIGTDPPCPRCDYLNQMVVDIVTNLSLPVTVRHVAYTSIEAQRLAKTNGLTPGTAKDVAKKLGITMDWTAIYKLIDDAGLPEPSPESPVCCPSPAAKWTPTLDEALQPCEVRALDACIMMTPVLVINGDPIHQGCVPDAEKTRKWIETAFAHISHEKRLHKEKVIEVLGPGCEKCNTLYENVLTAMKGFGGGEAYSVKKRTDIGYFQKMGVAVTPGLIINGEVISTGRVLTPEQIGAHLESTTQTV